MSRSNLDINLHRVDDLDAANAGSALTPCYKLLHLPTDRFGDLPGSISRWLDVSFLRSLHIEWIGSNGLTVWPCLQAVTGALEYLWLESNAAVQHDGTILAFPNLRSLVYTADPEAFVDFLLVIRAPRADYLDFQYWQWDLDSAVLLYRVFPSLRRVRYDLRCSEYGRHRYWQPGLDAIRMFTFFSAWRSLDNRIWAWLSGPPEEAAIATLQLTGLPVSTFNTYISNEWIASKVGPSRVVGRNFWNLEQYVITIDAAPGPIMQTCLRSMLSLDAPNLQELMICMRDHDPSILLRELAPVVEGGRFPSLRTLRFTATLLQLDEKEVKELVKHLRTSCERAGVDWSVEISPW